MLTSCLGATMINNALIEFVSTRQAVAQGYVRCVTHVLDEVIRCTDTSSNAEMVKALKRICEEHKNKWKNLEGKIDDMKHSRP